MEDMLRALQGTTIASTRPPAFIKLAPNDDGSSLPAAFFEHPDTYIKHIGPDGRIRSWGLYPYIPRGQQGAGYEDIPYPMMRKMMHQMTYAPLNRSSQLLRPEDQFMNAVLAQRKRQLKQVDLGDLTRRDYVLRIHMPAIQTATGEDRIWRRFIVSGGMSLGVFQDKVLAPLMGWVRNFHTHILTDYRDGTQYGPKGSGAVDMMHIDASGYDFLNEDDYCVAHLMAKVGDACQYEYDLGDHFRHDIIVEKIVSLEESYSRVQVLGGSGICPMENGKGNDTWAEHIETLTKSGTPAARRELLSEIYSMPNYTDRGWNKKSKFDPDYFDLAETTQAVMAALGTKLSYSPGAKTFKVPFAPEALLGPLGATKRKTTREVTMSPGDSFGFFEELKKDGRDSRRATACAACGNPNDLKACSGCGQRFYCGQACQKAHWKSTHKRECTMEKKKHASG
ncbi:MM3350-like domain-containing protein [Mycena alexandri]|uniref:MM3350-like domain-containing protein n=1 Tax=Mycena alexandri TaxID=1745969 RepID=A0AAD6SCE1_9AGAR|nr:MM3350-like domain-containing protein [Mycena alexandri]